VTAWLLAWRPARKALEQDLERTIEANKLLGQWRREDEQKLVALATANGSERERAAWMTKRFERLAEVAEQAADFLEAIPRREAAIDLAERIRQLSGQRERELARALQDDATRAAYVRIAERLGIETHRPEADR
jgi:hypothetical protein